MLSFILQAKAIREIYRTMNDDFSADDFWKLTAEQKADMKKRGEGQDQEYFMVNPAKLKTIYKMDKAIFLVSEEEKQFMLSGRELIYKISEDMPENTSFKERLFYARRILPSVITKNE